MMSGEQLRKWLKDFAAHELEPKEAWSRVARDVEKFVHDLHREIKTASDKLQEKEAECRARDAADRAIKERLKAAERENESLKARLASLEASGRQLRERNVLLASRARGNAYTSLPPPTPLRRALSIQYEWGEQHFDILVTAASIRTTEWEDTGEKVTWLQCKGVQTASIKDGQGDMMNLLIPAHYVTRAEPGGKFRVNRSKKSGNVGIFPPTKPTPPNPVPLAELERLIAGLVDTSLN